MHFKSVFKLLSGVREFEVSRKVIPEDGAREKGPAAC